MYYEEFQPMNIQNMIIRLGEAGRICLYRPYIEPSGPLKAKTKDVNILF
jgi:hypothetical protein